MLLATGGTNREIGKHLGVAERTARTHVSNILAKLGLASRTQAAMWAVKEGLVPAGSGLVTVPPETPPGAGVDRAAQHLDAARDRHRAAPPSDAALDAQLLELFFDRVPMGIAVFGRDMRLIRCNTTWTGFYEHYFGVGPEYTAPGRTCTSYPRQRGQRAPLIENALAGRVVRQAAHHIGIPGLDTYWDVVFAPLFENGEVVGVVDIVTDATDRVLAFRAARGADRRVHPDRVRRAPSTSRSRSPCGRWSRPCGRASTSPPPRSSPGPTARRP